MKTETDNFKALRDDFWREKVRNCKTPEQALAILRDEAGLSKGREVLKMREYRPDLYNTFRVKRPEFQPRRNPIPQFFHIEG